MTRIRVTIGVAIVAGVLVAAAFHGWLGDWDRGDKLDATDHEGRMAVVYWLPKTWHWT